MLDPFFSQMMRGLGSVRFGSCAVCCTTENGKQAGSDRNWTGGFKRTPQVGVSAPQDYPRVLRRTCRPSLWTWPTAPPSAVPAWTTRRMTMWPASQTRALARARVLSQGPHSPNRFEVRVPERLGPAQTWTVLRTGSLEVRDMTQMHAHRKARAVWRWYAGQRERSMCISVHAGPGGPESGVRSCSAWQRSSSRTVNTWFLRSADTRGVEPQAGLSTVCGNDWASHTHTYTHTRTHAQHAEEGTEGD